MTEVILCDFWNCHKRWNNFHLVLLLSHSHFSLSAHPWNPAARLAGSPGHMEKIHEGVSANRLLFGTDQQPLCTTARHVSEEALKANSIRCSSNCSYMRDSRQDHLAEHSESTALWEIIINDFSFFVPSSLKSVYHQVYFGAIDNWNRDQVAKWLALPYGLQILKVCLSSC